MGRNELLDGFTAVLGGQGRIGAHARTRGHIGMTAAGGDAIEIVRGAERVQAGRFDLHRRFRHQNLKSR